MDSSAKGQIAPTQAKITELNHSINIAKSASNMLSKKAHVFDMYLKDYAKKLETNTLLLEEVMKEAFLTLSLARYTFAPANLTVFTEQMVGKIAQVKVISFQDKFLGNARFYTMYEEEKTPEMWPKAGLGGAGQRILDTKKVFKKATEILVGQITLQSVFTSLCNAKETAMRKSMVIEKIVIPNILSVINYIRNYLDDMERDDMYRYKLVKRRYARKFDKPQSEVKEEHREES